MVFPPFVAFAGKIHSLKLKLIMLECWMKVIILRNTVCDISIQSCKSIPLSIKRWICTSIIILCWKLALSGKWSCRKVGCRERVKRNLNKLSSKSSSESYLLLCFWKIHLHRRARTHRIKVDTEYSHGGIELLIIRRCVSSLEKWFIRCSMTQHGIIIIVGTVWMHHLGIMDDKVSQLVISMLVPSQDIQLIHNNMRVKTYKFIRDFSLRSLLNNSLLVFFHWAHIFMCSMCGNVHASEFVCSKLSIRLVFCSLGAEMWHSSRFLCVVICAVHQNRSP